MPIEELHPPLTTPVEGGEYKGLIIYYRKYHPPLTPPVKGWD